MKVLVVGGAGYIGSVCAELLLNEDHSVGIFDNLSEGHRKAVDPRATFVDGDLSDLHRIQSTLEEFQPDAVMHFAANALVGESMQNPSKYFRNNIGNIGYKWLKQWDATPLQFMCFGIIMNLHRVSLISQVRTGI